MIVNNYGWEFKRFQYFFLGNKAVDYNKIGNYNILTNFNTFKTL